MTYLYSQCEDIACRSIAPLQDTPANKFTYTASITVDTGFIVKMSATDINSVVNETDKTTWTWSLNHPSNITEHLHTLRKPKLNQYINITTISQVHVVLTD